MTIGELARRAGVAVSTLRFYERRRLLAPAARSGGNYRLYRPEDVDRVRFIRRARELGFTLADVNLLLRSSSGTMRRAELDRTGKAKLADLDRRIADLRRVRGALAGLLALPCIDPAAPCPIVAALAGSEPGGRERARSGPRVGALSLPSGG